MDGRTHEGQRPIPIAHLELCANSGNSDQMPRFAVSDLGLHCLPMFHKKETRLKWVNQGL